MYAHLCHDNDFLTQQILKILADDINHSQTDFDEVIKYTPIFKNMSRVSISKENAIFMIESLFENIFLVEAVDAIKLSDSLLNTILEIIKRNPDACRYMRDLPDCLKDIERFHEKNIVPLSRGNKLLFKKIHKDRIEKHLTTNEHEAIEAYSTHRLDLFKQLLVEIDYEDLINQTLQEDRDKEELAIDRLLRKDEKVDYYKEDYKFWVDATVHEDYGAVLLVSYANPSVVINNPMRDRMDEQKTHVKINKDTCRPSGIYTDEAMSQINSIYEYLFLKIKQRPRY